MDDIEIALNKNYSIDLKLNTKRELKENDVYFEKYIHSKLSFKIDDVSKKYTYLGKEYDGDMVSFYLEIENIEQVNTIDITNKILMDHFPKQQNLIKSKVGKKHKSLLLTVENDKGLLKF